MYIQVLRDVNNRLPRTHVLRDLRPYVCMYNDCSTPEQLFSTRMAWLSHEASVHRRLWECRKHAEQFDSLSEIENHFRKQHSELQSQTDIDIQVSGSYTNMPDSRTTCPICLIDGPFEKGLENHLANHLERVSLFALPRNTEETDQSLSGSDKAHGIGSQSSSTELQCQLLRDESDSQGDYSEEPTAEGNLQQQGSLTVSQALQISRESPHDALDPAVSNILEDEFAQICSEMQSQPDSYVMTHDEFAVFNHFQQRLQGNRVADDARSRYWAAQRSSQSEQDDPTACGPADGDASGVVPSGAIAWGDWKRLADGQWHREGQDASGEWVFSKQSLQCSRMHHDRPDV